MVIMGGKLWQHYKGAQLASEVTYCFSHLWPGDRTQQVLLTDRHQKGRGHTLVHMAQGSTLTNSTR